VRGESGRGGVLIRISEVNGALTRAFGIAGALASAFLERTVAEGGLRSPARGIGEAGSDEIEFDAKFR